MINHLLSRKILNVFPILTFGFLLLFPSYLSSQILQNDTSESENVVVSDTIPEATFKGGEIHISGDTSISKNISEASALAQITVEQPNSETTWKVGREETIEWTTSGVYGDVRIWLYRGDGELVRRIYRHSGSGPTEWTVPPYIEPGKDYYIVIFSADNPDVRGRTDGTFTIEEGTGPYITMLSPTGGEKWTSGEEEEIRWTSRNIQGDVEILLYRDGVIFIDYKSRRTAGDGAFSWTVPDDIEPRTDYYVGVRSLDNESVWDAKGLFQIGFPNSDLSGIIDTRGEAWDVQVSGYYAYIADEDGGLTIADITNPSNAFEVGSIETPGRALTIDVIGNLAYVADESGGLRVFNISNPANPTEIGSFDTADEAWGITVSGDYAYVAVESDGLQILDISDPANPTEVSRFDTPGSAVNVRVRGDYAYIADYSSGLRILDISDPANPTEVSFLDARDDVWDVDLKGTYAYVADHGLRVIDISDPANPTEIGNLETSDSAWDVTVSGNYAYIAADNAGVRTINVSDPTSPVETGYFNTPDPAYGVSSAGEYVYVAAEASGVYIIRNQSDEDVTPPAVPDGLNALLGNGQITLTWNPNSETDLAEYRLYRFALPQEETEFVATISAGTESYTDTEIVNGRTYSYWVTAVDQNGNESGYSDEVQVSVEASTEPIPDRKINIWVHSPSYDFDSINWNHSNGTVSLENVNGYWGIEESQIQEVCSVDEEKENLTIKKNGSRVGIIYLKLCNQYLVNKKFQAILIINDEIEIDTDSSPFWEYYKFFGTYDEIMVSMLVAPNSFDASQSLAPNFEPVLAVHGVTGYYPYWGNNIIDEINNEDNFDLWQFYYPYDQPIYESGMLLGEAMKYLLGNRIFGKSASYQQDDLKILAHSMGGLVSRAHIQSDQFNNTISNLVMLGTPNHGSYAAYKISNGPIKGAYSLLSGRDSFAPAYREMVPGSSFLMDLNANEPIALNREFDEPYITVAGNRDETTYHKEIEDQDDEWVAIPSVSLLESDIPLLITNHIHTSADDPNNADGLLNAEGLVVPLLTGNYLSILDHPKYVGHYGFSNYPDKEIPDALGISILDINFTDFDYATGIRSTKTGDNKIKVFSTINNPSRAAFSDKVIGDIFNKSSKSFFIKNKLGLSDLGMNFINGVNTIEIGRYSAFSRRWISIGESTQLDYKPVHTNYSNPIELTLLQKMHLKIPSVNFFPKNNNERSDQLSQHIDSKVDTAFVYIEFSEEAIGISDYQISLTSPSGLKHSIGNIPELWDVKEDNDQGFAYFLIPDPENGNWEIDYNRAIGDAFVVTPIKSDIDIISNVPDGNHTVDEPVQVEVEVLGYNLINSYEIEAEYVCFDDNGNQIETDKLKLQVVETAQYIADLNAPQNSVFCIVETDLEADIGDEIIVRNGVISMDIMDELSTSINRGDVDETPSEIKLSQNYPNPFNPTTTIQYALPQATLVQLEVFNMLGQRVSVLVNEKKSAGIHTVIFNAFNLSSGIFIYRLQAGEFVETKKLTLIK